MLHELYASTRWLIQTDGHALNKEFNRKRYQALTRLTTRWLKLTQYIKNRGIHGTFKLRPDFWL